jgi:hypothetical protein
MDAWQQLLSVVFEVPREASPHGKLSETAVLSASFTGAEQLQKGIFRYRDLVNFHFDCCPRLGTDGSLVRFGLAEVGGGKGSYASTFISIKTSFSGPGLLILLRCIRLRWQGTKGRFRAGLGAFIDTVKGLAFFTGSAFFKIPGLRFQRFRGRASWMGAEQSLNHKRRFVRLSFG